MPFQAPSLDLSHCCIHLIVVLFDKHKMFEHPHDLLVNQPWSEYASFKSCVAGTYITLNALTSGSSVTLSLFIMQSQGSYR